MLDQYILYLVLVFILISLYFNLIGPAFTFVIAVVVLGISGILTPREILGGFANEQIIIIIILLLIGDIIRKKGVLNVFFEKWIFNGSKSYPNFMARMTFMIAGSSAFLNNTPLVAVMMPYVSSWGKKHQIAASKLLIPLSYAAILGGTATLIGTSTNLIVNGMVADQILFPNFKSLGIFDFAWVGIPMTILGIIYLLIFANKLLPNNEDSLEKVVSNRREYLVDIRIAPGSVTPVHMRFKDAESLFIQKIPERSLIKKAAEKISAMMVEVTGERWSTPFKRPVLKIMAERGLLLILEVSDE